MLRNFIKLFGRAFRKDLQFSIINLVGLSLGLAVVLLIFLYLHHDFAYDSYFEEGDNVFLVYEASYEEPGLADTQQRFSFSAQKGISKSPYMPTPLGPAIAGEVPELAAFARLNTWDGVFQLQNGPLSKEVHFTDQGFFDVLSFEFIAGDPKTALADQQGMVITESTAKSFFGVADVVGRNVTVDLGETTETFTITGVVKDPPTNITFRFECLARMEKRPYFSFHKDNWNAFNCPLLVKLQKGVSPEKVNQQLTALAKERYTRTIERSKAANKLGENDRVLEFSLYPLRWAHHSVDIMVPGHQSPSNNLVLLIVGVLILVIACLNFIILSISKSGGRRMEVGIRKVMGASRRQVFWQFQVESFMYVLISVLLSFGLVEILLPSFNQLSGLQLDSGYPMRLAFGAAVVILALLVGFFSGAYPSLYLARQLPVTSLRRGSTFTIRKGLLKWLVIGQFTISMVLIFSTFTMRRQMKFVAEQDLGFDKNKLVAIYTGQVRSAENPWQNYTTIKDRMLTIPGVENVTGSNASFGHGWSKYGYTVDGIEHDVVTYLADEDYLSTMGIKLLKGRNFIEGSEYDQKYSVIINEALARRHGWTDPIGKEVNWYEADQPIRVIGVIEDFHFFSMESEIQPMLLDMEAGMEPFFYTLVKLGPGDPELAVAAIEAAWKELYPTKPFSWSFVDQDLEAQYQPYRQWIAYMQYATGFAWIIGCMGLFGLSRILSQNRTKEIGIRKVFGAGVVDILKLMNMEILWMVFISSALGIPLALWMMNKWLQHFHFHISIGWEIAAISVSLALVVALLTVSFQTVKSSLANPVDSLRHE